MWRQQDKQRLDAAAERNEQRLVFPVQMLLVTVTAPDQWRPGVDQQDPEPVNIKEEQVELWTSLEGTQLKRNEETDDTRLEFTAVPKKCDNKEGKLQFSQLHQQQMEDRDDPTSSSADQITVVIGEEDCEEADTQEDASSFSETEISDDCKVDEDEDENDPDYWPKTDNRDKEWEAKKKAPGLDVNTVNKSVSCSECGKQFLHKGSLQRHMTCHPRAKSSNCSAKTKSVRVKKKAESCKKVQTKGEDLSLDNSGKRFQKGLVRHTESPTAEKPFACDVCEHRFDRKTSLNAHMVTHTGQRPFVCDVCGRSFSHKTNLNRHLRTHTGLKPFACDVCGHRFNQEATLNTHMRTHTGQKPFACDVCGHRFSHKTSLNTHMRIHTGQKPFACSVCGHRFSHRTTLNAHMRTHTGQKPFGCDICGHRFSHKTNLNKHVRIHTGQKPFACDVCGHKFSQKTHLNKHMRIHLTKPLLL